MESKLNAAALQRLVGRHPILIQDPSITTLVSKGLNITNEDIIHMCHKLLLKPELTIAVAGCFRHLLPQMVTSMVDILRESYSQRTVMEILDKCGQECSISIRSWCLCLHEYVAMAFSRLLELAPHLLSTFVQYFSFAPPPFERLLHNIAAVGQPLWQSKTNLLDIVRASYLFIHLEPSIFKNVWDWSPFLELLLYKDLKWSEQDSTDVRWCAVQILSLKYELSDEATRAVSSRIACLPEDTAFSCLLRWEEFCQEIAVEKGGWYVEPPLFQGEVNTEDTSVIAGKYIFKWKHDMSSQITHVEVCGIELPVRKNRTNAARWPPLFGQTLFMTSRLKSNLKALALALSQQEPVLLEGPPGCGKTSLIRELAEVTGNSDAVYVHLNEQIDGKTLLGTYVCTEVPGDFRWQPGAVTQAVLKGLWLVIEDVDRASSEVLSALVSLLESRKLYIPGQAETVQAAEGFQLFSTLTRTDRVSTSYSPGVNILNTLWRRIVMLSPNNIELESLIEMLFPLLRPVVAKLIETWELVNGFAIQGLSSVETTQRILFGRQFSLRDLLKWCKRLKDMKELGPGVQTSAVCEVIFREAIDCFAAYISDKKARHFVMDSIARLWGIPEEQVMYFESLNKPPLQALSSAVHVGRACLPVNHLKERQVSGRPFAYTGHSMRNLERIAVCIQQQEPVLLVGETGTGKTTLVQHLAEQASMPLIVMNLSQQSDSADFIGGFKPVEAHFICMKLMEKFQDLFCRTFPSQQNSEFLARMQHFMEKKKLKQLLKACRTAVAKVEAISRSANKSSAEVNVTNAAADAKLQPKTKRKQPLSGQLMLEWEKFSLELSSSQRQVSAAESSFAFTFVEGAFVRALRNGQWILLDELNLAPVETLERLTGVLEGDRGSLYITERGDIQAIPRHPNFRVFACMNPATDVGKHDLPLSLKNRFTEIYVDELTGTEDLETFVFQYLQGVMPSPPVGAIVEFYQQAQQEAEVRLFDSANQKPRYSLRSLARALEYTQAAMPYYGFARALYDGVCMTFLTLLDRSSSVAMEILIRSILFKRLGLDLKSDSLLTKAPGRPSSNHIEFEHFWLERGGFKSPECSLESKQKYILTKTVREHLKNVAKAVFIKRYPVLLQGPTSSGKTSAIEYLATITGHRFVRINNHEHTDLQEYLGTYVTGPSGKLVFQEGILVEAVRNGYWIVLDELNLAPSEVLEALNRLLDDNRELFVPELQIRIKPHPHFMLFATQNPPGLYGGRKALSRAFRNRFLELHVDDIPADELCVILEKRCEIPRSYAVKMVAVMKDLQRQRQSSQVFAGKHGFITARDLFKWAERHRRSGVSYEDLAKIGYVLLAERLRDANERLIVHDCLEKNLHCKINIEKLYIELSLASHIQEAKEQLATHSTGTGVGNIVWTKSLTRLFSLVKHCYEHREPMLLIGETGCGKTTVCQLLAMIQEQYLHILNCHQHTETADFLGGFRPVRERESIADQFGKTVRRINSSELFLTYESDQCPQLPESIESAENTMKTLEKVIAGARASSQFINDAEIQKRVISLEPFLKELKRLRTDWQALFIWQDGPLVQAMREGDLFLVDEISLADDSILERLNSVLEPKRLLVLAEKGGSNVEELVAHPNFLLMATMNPGGDFGKKELSPALRNRFTEIWVPPIADETDLRSIIATRFLRPCLTLTDPLLNFWKWYQKQNSGRPLTVRDLLSWIHFINTVVDRIGLSSAFIHGAFLVLLDGIGLGMGFSIESARILRNECLKFLLQQVPLDKMLNVEDFDDSTMMTSKIFSFTDTVAGINPFFIPKGSVTCKLLTYELMAPTTSINTFRILRAMQLSKPVLIEGSPGVGKTSLITALANISCHYLVRINLSEQTDMMDLLGSDLPAEGSEGADFRWSDGVFLQALKSGKWVVLDELNLASQSVLEGLNACLDHRGEVFIPELGRSFKCHPDFRIFACQNPSLQGGGRKSLPRSFLNRFTKVFVDTLSEEDFVFIASSLHPSIPRALLQKLVHFNAMIFRDTMVSHAYGHLGAPWEFNLRDVLRSCTLLEGGNVNSFTFLEAVYLQRMRTAKDRRRVLKLYEDVFESPACLEAYPSIVLDSKWLKIGNAMLQRLNGPQTWSSRDNLLFLPSQLKCLESLMLCVQHGWMSVLVGPPACGKTSVVRLLAKLTGTPLREFVLSSGTDTTDLLGCFEQYDELRSWQKLVKTFHHLVQETFARLMVSDDMPSDVLVVALRKLVSGWSAFEMFSSSQDKSRNTQNLNQENFQSNRLSSLSLLSNVLDHIKYLVSMLTESSSLGSDIVGIELEMAELKKRVSSKVTANHFEWVDGGFLRAVERGDWVLLENANLCSPTVLDRLNPLLEPNGMILVNERGLVNGNAMVLRAHPNFRLFLTVDPNHGEISRAMRNRGVEIFMMQPFTWIENAEALRNDQEVTQDMEDFKRYLVHMGIPTCALVTSMLRAHMGFKMVVESSLMSHTASIRELGQWVGLFEQILRRGSGLSESLSCSWDQIYVQGCQDVEERCAISNVFNARLDQVNASMILESTLQLPGGWPRPLKIEQFCRMSKEAITLRDCMYLQVLFGKQVGHHIISAWCRADSDEKANLLKWLLGKKNLAVMLPAQLFQALMYPSFVEFILHEKSTDVGLSELDKMIIYASLWIMEQARSRVANDMYLMWLNTQAANVGVYSNSLVLVSKMLKRTLEHSQFKQALSALEEERPIEGFQLEKLDALRRTLMQWQIEDDMYEKYQGSTLKKRQSLLMQSFEFHTSMPRMNMTELKPNDVIEGLYSLFLSLRHLEQEVFCCSEFVWNDKACKTYLRFLDSHKAIWKGACDTDSARKVDHQSSRLFFSWKKLRKNTNLLISILRNSKDKLQKAKDHAIHVFEGLERLFCRSRGEFKLSLWKHSGHPCVPSSKQAFHQLQLFSKFCDKLWPNDIIGTRNFTSGSLSVVFRRLALEGIGMSLCLLQGTLKDGEGTLIPKGGDTTEPIVVTSDILMNLENRFEIEKLQRESSPSRITGCCKCWPSHLVQNSEYWKVLLQDHSQGFNLLLFSWLDSLSLIKDSRIVAGLTEVASGLDCGNASDISFREELKEELRGVVDFSLELSSRSPFELVPHQQILWLINSNTGAEQQKGSFLKEFCNFAHQLRFNWHSSIWKNEFQQDQGFGISNTGADFVFSATNCARLSHLITQVVPVKQYERKILELRLAARVLWTRGASGVQHWRKLDFLHASSVFCQTVLAFTSSFEKEEAALLQTVLNSLHLNGGQGLNGDSNHEVSCLKVLLRKSTDHRFVALLDSHVNPCLDLLYAEWCRMSLFTDYVSVHGKIWLLLGATRLKLMLPKQAYDPAAKYTHEHAVLLEEISDTKLELQVRQESESVVRGCALSAHYWEFHCKIQDLECEAMDRASKCAYREQPGYVDNLYHEVGVFIESLKGDQDVHAWMTALGKKAEKAVVDRTKAEVWQWQDISMEFIQRITRNYPDYQDLAQPVLLSVFEMKFGLSMLLSAFQQKQSLLLEDGLNGHASSLYENVCLLMEYPSRNSVFEKTADHSVLSSALPALYFLNDNILKSMSCICEEEEHEKENFMMNLKVKLFRCAIARLKKALLNAGFVHGPLLQAILTLLGSVAVFWNNMRDKLDAREQEEVSLIQFKHQSLTLGLDNDLDEEAFKKMFPLHFEYANENSNEVCTVEEIHSKDSTMSKTYRKTWNVHASMLAKDLTFLQSLFPGVQAAQDRERPCRALSDDERLEAFNLSYDVGKTFLEGTCPLLPASLNERLVLANMLMLSVKHENLVSPTEKKDSFNIYQDASPAELEHLLKSLNNMQVCISKLLAEWPDQPSLVQLLRGVESLLSMSVDVPLIKVLNGVEQLLSKAQIWEENAPKRLSLKDVLAKLHHLVSRWRKFELAHWEVLLREVEFQFEQEAEKLWFPLYGVLHPIAPANLESDFEPTIASLEEFMETATLGEFKKRFQMLRGFYGQFYVQQSFSSVTTKILYNILGYYSKFLPLIEDFTAVGKSEIEKELKNFLKLHKWDERNYYALLSSSENTHRKLFKLINKFKVFLNKPALATVFDEKAWNASKQIADLEEKDNGAKVADDLHGLYVKNDYLTSNEKWQSYLQKKFEDLTNFMLNDHFSEEVAGLFKELPSLLPQFWRLLNSSAFAKDAGLARQRGTVAFEDLGRTVIIRSNELRENEKKRLPKKKALVDLLKELRNLGFSHHRSAIPRDERMPKSWNLQPVCRVDEFLTTFQNVSTGCKHGTRTLGTEQMHYISHLWSKACDYYFQNLALIQQLRQQSLSFHKDLTLQEVTAATAYVDHALYLQQRQRCFSQEFSVNLVSLQIIACQLGTFDLDDGTILGRPELLRSWLWRQKDILDSVYSTCLETSLLYKKAEAVQTCPFDKSSSEFFAIILSGLEKAAKMLSSCKINLDHLLSPGSQIFAANDIVLNWPILITPSEWTMIVGNSLALQTVKGLIEKLPCQPGLSPLLEICGQASNMVDDFKEQSTRASSITKAELDAVKEAYEKQRDQFVSEVLLSMQALNRISSRLKSETAADYHNYVDLHVDVMTAKPETVQSSALLIEEQMSGLRLGKIHQTVMATLDLAVKQMSLRDETLHKKLCKDFHAIHEILDLVIAAGLAVFSDYVSLHKSLTKLTYILSKVFGTLFREGFCIKESEQEQISQFEDGLGTGMGEGQGKTDVSHEIDDEDQLLGTNQKDSPAKADNNMGENTSKGVEMTEDFDGDFFNVSESESNATEEDENEDEELESKMEEGGENENIVDEKLWGKQDDEGVGNGENEKYESGSSVQDSGTDLELRAKEDGVDAANEEGSKEDGRLDSEQENPKTTADDEHAEEDSGNVLDKCDAYEPSSGIDPSAETSEPEKDMELTDEDNIHENFDEVNESIEGMDLDNDASETPECSESEQESPDKAADDMDYTESLKDSSQDETKTQLNAEQQSKKTVENGDLQGVSGTALAGPSAGHDFARDSSTEVSTETSMDLLTPQEPPAKQSDGSDLIAKDPSAIGQQKQTADSELSGNNEAQTLDRLDADPYRCLGDYLKAWKERVVITDESLPETNNEDSGHEGMEYQYVREDESTGAQALGSATADQINQSRVDECHLDRNMSRDVPVSIEETRKEGDSKMVDQDTPQLVTERKLSQKVEGDSLDNGRPMVEDVDPNIEMGEGPLEFEGASDHLKSYVSASLDLKHGESLGTNLTLNATPCKGENAQKIRRELEMVLSKDGQSIHKARILWSKYEQLTTRLSQELTEQLRLIMEPTLAARLEGDYRTGKRINLKKVIPYIASQFRRDKIWLRRTKPSKRQYQVVLAIDDSRSMSENHCGHTALEALITICRSMSALEVGQMAVASFGQKGNVKLLHDFDTPFSSEAGIQIISEFTFKQENTIKDEPMVDLLHYLTWMLDAFAMSHVNSSGRPELRQLILIIADGRFHEKETLRRCIREAVSRGQMLAFIVLDNARESIMDVQSVSFSGGAPMFTKYIDTFPFPYYILLKNIEELPQTLADLLRQWFELNQRAKLQ